MIGSRAIVCGVDVMARTRDVVFVKRVVSLRRKGLGPAERLGHVIGCGRLCLIEEKVLNVGFVIVGCEEVHCVVVWKAWWPIWPEEVLLCSTAVVERYLGSGVACDETVRSWL